MHDKSVYTKRRIILAVSALLLLSIIIPASVFAVKFGMRRYQNYLKYSKIRMIKGELKRDQVLFDALLESQISREAANDIIESISPILNMRKLQVQDEFRIYLNENNQIEKFIYEKSPIDQYFVVRGEYGKLHAFKPAIFLSKKTIAKELTIKSSLFEAMLEAEEKDALVFEFVDVFAWDIDFYTYPRVGDKIRIYFEKYYKDDKFIRYGKILAAQYDGRNTFDAVYFAPKNSYYTLDGKPAEKMFLKSPLKFTGRITSLFGYRRDPFTHRHGKHNGVDFASYYGAPIIATSDGIVSYVGWKGAYGRLITVKHANGYVTYYGHCSSILAKAGQKVNQGQIIAKVGSTGRSTGPHCHYEIRLRKSAFNPLQFNQPRKDPLKGKDLEDFKLYAKKVWESLDSSASGGFARDKREKGLEPSTSTLEGWSSTN